MKGLREEARDKLKLLLDIKNFLNKLSNEGLEKKNYSLSVHKILLNALFKFIYYSDSLK